MAEATVVGRTRVSLIPDTSTFGPTLREVLPKAVRPGALKAADVIHDTIQRRLETMTPTVKVKASLDVTGIKERLDTLTRTRPIKLQVELDAGAAKTQLDKLTADRKVKVTAEADTGKAGQALDRLTRDRTVKVGVDVDESAARSRLDKLLGQRTVDILPKIQEAAYNTAVRQLDRLCKDRVVNIRASVDTRVAANELRGLTQRRNVRILADVDTRVAANDLANLTRRRTASIVARANTTDANRALAFAARDRTANIRVRSTGLSALTGALSGLGGGGGGAGGLGLLSSRFVALGAAALGAFPAIASLGSALAQMGPLAATAAPALATLLGGFAAIKIGTSGVGDAIKAAFSGTDTGAKAAASATRQVESAQRSLATAQRGVADAERSLSQAQRAARQAQAELSVARREATRALQDMNAQLKQGRLDQKQAALDVQQAEEDLARVRSDPAATQLQIQQADLALQRAKANVDEQARQQKRLAADTAAANKAGVDGSDQVVQAREKIRAANEQVAEQQRNLQDAHRQVADAARQVAQAHEAAAAQTSKLDQALAKLSPNARAFVGTLRQMAPAWRGMKLDVQDRLFAGLGTRLQSVGSQILPTVRTGLVGAAGALSTMAKNALNAVSNLEKTGTLGKLFDGIRSSLGNLSRIPGQLLTGFAQLSVAAQPVFDRMTKGLAGAMDRVMDKLGKAFKDGSLTKAIDNALDVALQFGKVLADLGGIITGVFKAAAAGGGDFFGVIGSVIKEINRVVNMPEVQAALTKIFSAISAVAGLLAGALGSAIQAVLPILAELAPTVEQLTEILGPVIQNLVKDLGAALMPVAQALGPVLVVAAQAIGTLVTALSPLLPVIGNLVAALLPPLIPLIETVAGIFTMLTPVIQLVATLLGVTLRPIIEALTNVVVQIAQAFAEQFMVILQQLIPVIPQLIPVVLQLAQSIVDILIAVTPLIPQIMLFGVMLLTQLLPALLPLIGPLTQITLLFLKLATFVIVGIVVPALQGLIDFMTTMREKFQPAYDAVKWLTDKIAWLFNLLFDFLLGHSIIPDIVNGTIRWFGDMRRKAGEIFTNLKDSVSRIWRQFWGNVKSTASDAWGKIKDGFDRFKDGLQQAFRDMKDGIKRIWDGIKNVVKSPVKFWIETVYNNGIRSVWNRTAAHLPGVGELKELPLPKGFARGGILPGWSTYRDGDDQLVPMRRGEGVYVSEAMRDPYERARLHAVNAAAMSGRSLAQFRGFADGGIVGDIKSGISKAFSKGGDAVRGGLADLAETAFKPVKKGISKALGGNNKTWPGLVGGLPNSLIDKTIAFIRGKEAESGGSGRWMKPVNAPITTRFGTRGPMWASGRHTGVDFAARTGTKVVAVDNGTVTQSVSGGPYGKHVMISHGGGLASLYAHMSALKAQAGDVISRGSRVGLSGATGNVTGPHLHLEARKNGIAVNPMPYFHAADAGGKGVQRWRGVVESALRQVGQSLNLASTTLRRMNQESGGNPNAVNTNDINWALGHPSVGLMQVIRGTFQAYAGKYRKVGPFKYGVSVDPLANVYASMRYALKTYGSLSRAYNRPGGYAMGGIIGGLRVNRGLPRGGGYASGGVIRVGGKRIDTGPVAASVGSAFLKSLAGTAAQIDAAMDKVAKALKNAFKGVKTTLDDKLLKQVSTQNKALQALAKSRDEIKAKISAAGTLAKDTTAQAVQFTALTSLPSAGNAFGAEGVLAGLTSRLTQVKSFGKDLKTLAARGLNKALLQQIIAAGPEQGAAYARALVDATPQQLKDINAVQASIGTVTTAFGKDAADALYDAGVDSGKGYLTGLASTQKLIEAQMAKIAKAVQKTIKVELKIKSPSRVLHALGRFSGLGYSGGVEETIPRAVAAAKRMAGAVRATAAGTTTRVQQQTNIRQGGDRHLHYSATVKEVASRKSILDALAVDEMLHRPVMVG
ncbi:peptidoglycan DD-metalloendopeptidase family protein [Streptomyces sp. NPDC052225]|uniref:peptidoglycan DD-metalloendopeptidase family protein n=1 Tax=Streptomyces sp. NPDC052225 TaxID=3154949 RepID=UPI00343211F5